ncbi:hypothetical protein SEA_AYOTOYA_62 [Gordonia phage Ayotoya]|nr:hypothetical protein SEA_AYOTOYA_62 [Gordonia phage Ayotoya]URP21289.1 hypothetical protein SEA_CHOP_62 [Gordonia phage Chop]UXL91337.1 hypothetical protein SEA_GRANDSLAM_62 [Gordonia phage GrandSlam]
MAMFTLHDLGRVLEPEDFATFEQALNRTVHPLWSPRRWQIVDPAGRNAASASTVGKRRPQPPAATTETILAYGGKVVRTVPRTIRPHTTTGECAGCTDLAHAHAGDDE